MSLLDFCRKNFFSISIQSILMSHVLTYAHTTPITDKPSFPSLTYWDNWTDIRGISHLTQCHITAFRPIQQDKNSQTPTALIWTGSSQSGTGNATVKTTVQPPGWSGNWNNTERTEWIVPVAGTFATETMDGTRIELNPGDILLNEDIGSATDKYGHKGHISSNIGKNAVALVITHFNTAALPHHKPCVQH